MFGVSIITISDKGAKGEREDLSGEAIKEIVENNGYSVVIKEIIPDEEEKIYSRLLYMCDDLKVDLVLTTGGTGFSKRDVTPEATKRACEKMTEGISEAIRQYSLNLTKRAMLSRAVSGIRGETLIINLPGSPKAVRESLEYIIASINHGLEILTGRAHDCARE